MRCITFKTFVVFEMFQWHVEILEFIERAGKADMYPQTKEGLLALTALDLSRCKLIGKLNVMQLVMVFFIFLYQSLNNFEIIRQPIQSRPAVHLLPFLPVMTE